MSVDTTSMRKSALCFLFFTGTVSSDFYALSLHDALPIFLVAHCRPGHNLPPRSASGGGGGVNEEPVGSTRIEAERLVARSEEHTSELQSRRDLVCRLLLEKNKAFRHLTPNL